MVTDEEATAKTEPASKLTDEGEQKKPLTFAEKDCNFTPLTKEELAKFNPQEFLMERIEHFSGKALNDKHKFRYVMPVTQGLPSKINQYFIGTPGVEPFINIDAKTFAQITPKVDLFKVVYPQELADFVGPPQSSHKTKVEVPIPFNKTFSKDEKDRILQNRDSRGVGAGIISFDWELAGTNPAEAKTFIKASLKIFLKSVAELDIVRATFTDHNNTDHKLRYLDLIHREKQMIPPPGEFREGDRPEEVYNPNYFLLKANVGWRVNDSMDDRGTGIKNALEACQTTMYLSLYKHEMDFNEDGSVILTCEYIGYVASLLASMDLLNPIKKTTLSIYGEVDFDYYQNLLQDLITDTGRMYFTNVNRYGKPSIVIDGEPDTDGSWDFWYDIGKEGITGGDIGHDMSELTKEQKEVQDSFNEVSNFGQGDTNSLQIKWFYFGDLLDTVLKYAYKEPGMDSVRFMVGPVILDEPSLVGEHNTMGIPNKKAGKIAVNLCDIPISLDMYLIWFQEEIVNKKLPSLSVSRFLQLAFDTLIKGAIMSGISRNLYCKRQKSSIRVPKLAFSQFTLPEAGDGSDPVFGPGFNPNLEPMPIKNKRVSYRSWTKKQLFQTARHSENKHYQYYLLYSANSDSGMFPSNVDEPKDEENSVYYFSTGRKNNIVRSIKFNKQDVPNLSEANIERSGMQNTILRGFYNATVVLEGAPIFKPGMIVYIDGAAMGAGVGTKSLTQKLGFGGYYTVLKASHEIESGNFATTLECLWLSFGTRTTKVRFIDHEEHGMHNDPFKPHPGIPIGD